MVRLKGKYNEAIIYAEALEMKCEDQILQYLDHPIFADTKVRIMPDAHFSKGATVGFTASCSEYVAPSIIGVDIGCGVNAYNLGSGNVAFDKLDKYIRKHIPFGREVNSSTNEMLETAYGYVPNNTISFKEFMEKVSAIATKVNFPPRRAFASLGTL
ncbi:MAG: RtcB family protein, partial [Holosporaceae bacterium]|nr:RtcB family protein [Holosporaceae bacterium]